MPLQASSSGPSPYMQSRRPTVNLSTRRASFADARLLGSLFVRSFGDDPMCYWLYQWPVLKSPTRAAAMNETRRIRLPATKRGLVSSKYHTFIASDQDTGEPIGVATWLVPKSDDARHHLRKLSLYERIAGFAFQLYDALISAVVPRKLYALFYPEDAARLQRQVRWQAEMDRSTKPFIQASHERVGYWYLSFLCVLPQYAGRGVGTSMLKWGIDKADEEDRAIYLTASPAGASVYRGAGFQTVFTDSVFEGEKGGPVPLCTMYRPSKSERQQEKE